MHFKAKNGTLVVLRQVLDTCTFQKHKILSARCFTRIRISHDVILKSNSRENDDLMVVCF